MYYEEKMIDGVLYYRTNPRDAWTPKKATTSAPATSTPTPPNFNRDQMAWEIYRDCVDSKPDQASAPWAYQCVDFFLAEMAKQHEAKP